MLHGLHGGPVHLGTAAGLLDSDIFRRSFRSHMQGHDYHHVLVAVALVAPGFAPLSCVLLSGASLMR